MVKKEYKSSIIRVWGQFVTGMAIVLGIMMIFIISWNRADDIIKGIMRMMIIIIFLLGTALAAYLSFYRHNIRIVVENNAITFYRGHKQYLAFDLYANTCTSYVKREYLNGVLLVGIKRYLRVFTVKEGNYKSYRCFNFSAGTFDECMAYIRYYTGERTNTRASAEASFEFEYEPHTFAIPKSHWLSKEKKSCVIECIVWFVILAVLFLWMVAFTNRTQQFVRECKILLVILSMGGLFHIFKTEFLKIYKIKKQAPETIKLYHDRILFDQMTFLFEDIRSLRMVPPNYTDQSSGGKTISVKIIKQSGSTVSYILYAVSFFGNRRGIMQDQYDLLYHELEMLLTRRTGAGEPCKFLSSLS